MFTTVKSQCDMQGRTERLIALDRMVQSYPPQVPSKGLDYSPLGMIALCGDNRRKSDRFEKGHSFPCWHQH